MMKIEISFSDLKEIRKIVRVHAQLATKQLNNIRSSSAPRGTKGWAARQAEETKALLHLLDKLVWKEETTQAEERERWAKVKDQTEIEAYVDTMFGEQTSVNGEGR